MYWGVCPPLDIPTPRPVDVSTCFRAISFLFIFLRTLVHTQKTHLFCFQPLPHSLSKNTRGGGTSVPRARPYQRRLPRSEPVTSHLFGHPSHCSQTFLVQQLASVRAIFKIPGNNSALPGV